MKIIPLTPLENPPREYEFVAFDTEGDGRRGGFICAAAVDSSGPRFFTKRAHLKEFLFSHRNRGKIILAANLEYDCAVAFQPFDDRFTVLLDNGRWLKATYRDTSGHSWPMWDLQRIAPLTVAEMGQVIGLPKYPTPSRLKGGDENVSAHFVCELHRRTDCLECYCVRDALVVFNFAAVFQSELLALSGELKPTAASCAMNLFRRRFLKMEIAPTFTDKNDKARQALHGGRVENFKAGTELDVYAYDFNSLYPAVMREAEVGLPSSYHRLTHTKRLFDRLEGFGQFTGTIEFPTSYVPVLPVRSHGHTYFPTGRLRGSWPFSEVRYALSQGARILDLDEIIFADSTVRPFTEFVDELYQKRLAYQVQGDPRERIVKILMNGLYGKFAQRSDGGLQALIIPKAPYELSDFEGCWPETLNGREVFLKEIIPEVQSPHVHVLWSAEIASQARLKLHSLLREADSSLYYTDTDSIHTTRPLVESSSLGGLKLEHRFLKVTYFAPKEYGGIDTRGEWVLRAKGIPREAAEVYLAEGSVSFKQPTHLLTALRTGDRIGVWKQHIKERRLHPPCRDYPALPDYNGFCVDSRPYPVELLSELD